MGWDLVGKIENRVRKIITQQEINGFQFDVVKAKQFIQQLTNKLDELEKGILEYLDYVGEASYASVKTPFKKDGTYKKQVYRDFGDNPDLVGGPYTPVVFRKPDIGSRYEIIKQLQKFGWKPDSFTEKGNPQLTEQSLLQLDHPIGKMLAEWYIYKHRLSTIQGWLENVREDGRIPARANTVGTPTARFRHSIIVNIPKATPDVLFGYEMRSLFISAPGHVLIGYDAEGLELRLLAHYINDPEFTKAIVEGDKSKETDIHTLNMKTLGLESRDLAKTLIYAFIYGAGDEKIGSIIGGTAKDGKRLRELLLARYPTLRRLVQRVQKASERGWIRGIDGRRIMVDSPYKALNRLIQSSGAIVMKISMIYLDKWIYSKYTLEQCKKVADMHDEGVLEVVDDQKVISDISDLASRCIPAAGKFFKLKCPLATDVRVGHSWAEIH